MQLESVLVEQEKNGILHLDIKPGNIFQRIDGSFCLFDYGLVGISPTLNKAAIGDLPPEPRSFFSGMFGTPAYMAPEQASGKADQRNDLYSLNILKAKGNKAPTKVLLGTIVEVRLPEGLDTLAVFVDGSARYINHTGKIAVVEGTPNDFETEIAAVIDASKPIVVTIGPWDKNRLEAPAIGNIRMSFLVSDGLYFGEGRMEQMASPLIDAAVSLLQKLADKTTNSDGLKQTP